MLVRFKSPAHHDVLMFGAVAASLLALMGTTGRVPSALQPEDLPAAHQKLLAGLTRQPALAAEAAAVDDGEEDEQHADDVPLRQRALPLLALLEAARAKHAWVMWEQAN